MAPTGCADRIRTVVLRGIVCVMGRGRLPDLPDIREEAANLLSALASDAARTGRFPDSFYPPGDWSRWACEVAYYAHRPDPDLTLPEQLAEAEARVREGAVHHPYLALR